MHRSYSHFITFSLAVLAAIAFLFTSCKDKGGGTEPPEQTPDINVNLIAKDGSDASLDGLTISSGGQTLATDVSGYTATEKKGQAKSYSVSKDGYASATKAVSFDEDKTVAFTLTKEKQEAETVEITANLLLDGEAYAEATVYNADTDAEIGSGSPVTLTRKKGSELAVRIDGPDIEAQVETLNFDETKTLDINLVATDVEPETVRLSVTVQIDGRRATRRTRGDFDFAPYRLTIGETRLENT